MSSKSKSDAYAAAGVDIEAGYEGVKLMKKHVERTFIPGVVSDIGGFGGLFVPDIKGMEEPVLVSGTDGVGTKQRIAQLMDKHDTVGIDCVAMCVNDIICCGSKPIIFLDYIAIGKNDPHKVADLVAGVAEGCVQAGCALIGGETAEHPGTMTADDYDLAGFSVGIADKPSIIDNSRMKEGDAVIALPSTGIHSNGFSLVRKVFDVENIDLHKPAREVMTDKAAAELLGDTPIGEALLVPTKIYVKPVLKVLESCHVHGISHITGGGFYENVPRSIPDGLGGKIKGADVRVLPVFKAMQAESAAKGFPISDRDMFNTFNMGVGMVVIVPAEEKETAVSVLQANGIDAYVVGESVKSEDKITIF